MVLHVASQRGNTEIVEKLLEAGAENSEDNNKVLILTNWYTTDTDSIFQITPFQTACLWGRNAETVAVFLERNVAKVDDTALYLAVSGGYE